MAVPVRLDLVADLQSHTLRLANALGRFLEERRMRVEGLARGLPDPRTLLENAQQRLDDRAERLALGLLQLLRFGRERLGHLPERLSQGFARLLEQRRLRLENLTGRLESHRLSHDNILKRGYALARDAAGAVVISAKAVLPGAELGLEFHDGRVAVRAEGGARKPAKPPGSKPDQGSLL
jgi:exodeoxyribonuclease VII large subunit